MKTPIKIQLKNTLSTSILFILVMISSLNLASQNSSKKSSYLLGISAGSDISGNSHGAIFNGGVNLYNGKNMFTLGACIQKRSMELTGGRFSYMRILTGHEDLSSKQDFSSDPSRLQLYFYSAVQYLNDAQLCYNAVKKEETLVKNPEEMPSNSNKIKLSTIDVSVGIGVNVKLTKQIVLSNYVGFGTYYHLNYTPGMYCDKVAPVLVLGTALRLNYFTNKIRLSKVSQTGINL